MLYPSKTGITLSFITLLILGCTGDPKFPNINNQPTPKVAANHPGNQQVIVWGGVIIHAHNLPETTRLEILAYPLERYYRPKTNKEAEGRFFIEQDGYLETADYAPNRKITVSGKIIRIEKGKVGEAEYDFPLIKATKIHLWPKSPPQQKSSDPHIRLGFGIILSN
jgi:outer membrane lipoprotein